MNAHPPANRSGHDADPQALAVELEPTLRDITNGQLGPIEWFRSPWQQGGAATGYSTWTLPDGQQSPVLIKLPVGSCEHFWSTALCNAECTHSPKVLADGTSLGNYDLAWLVLERLQGKTLGRDLTGPCLSALLEANCDIHQTAGAIRPITAQDAREPTEWDRLIALAQQSVIDNGLANEKRWLAALRRVAERIGVLVGHWRARMVDTWCHGDMHPGNALYRGPGKHEGDLVLIDFALMHAGHWMEDALYLERLYWGHEDLLHGVRPVSALARLRKDRGLSTGDDYPYLANVRRVLMASCVPAFLAREGNPVYVEASLGILERIGQEILH